MKKHIPLIIGIALPFVMILAIILSIFLPRMFINPKYSFIYTTNSYSDGNCVLRELPNNQGQVNDCDNINYVVDDGRVVENHSVNGYRDNNERLYFYDVVRDSSRIISIEEAGKFLLSTESRSPDGFEVSYQYSNSGIFELFGVNNRGNHWVMKKGIATKALSVANDDQYYYRGGQVDFLGWVIQ